MTWKIKGVDHVAVCVRDLEAESARYAGLLDREPGAREVSEELATEALLFPLENASLELISPTENPALERFLDKRGPGLHHIAFAVEGLDEALAALKAKGVPLIDETPKVGARGHRVAFIHPKAVGGVLIELVETE